MPPIIPLLSNISWSLGQEWSESLSSQFLQSNIEHNGSFRQQRGKSKHKKWLKNPTQTAVKRNSEYTQEIMKCIHHTLSSKCGKFSSNIPYISPQANLHAHPSNYLSMQQRDHQNEDEELVNFYYLWQNNRLRSVVPKLYQKIAKDSARHLKGRLPERIFTYNWCNR